MRSSDWSSDVCSSDLIGLSVFMMNTMLLVFGTEPRNIETGIGAAPLIIGTIVITKVRVITIIVSIVAIVAVHYLINHTRRGRAMRAVFQQKEDRKSTRLNSSH